MAKDFNALPPDTSDLGTKAWEGILTVLRKYGCTDTGGCTTFYSPAQWRGREEAYGTDSELIVVYDGGDVATVLSYMYDETEVKGQVGAEVEAVLSSLGLYMEPCTNWYSAIYRI